MIQDLATYFYFQLMLHRFFTSSRFQFLELEYIIIKCKYIKFLTFFTLLFIHLFILIYYFFSP